MDRGRLIGGIICLVLAALLGILNLTLSPDKMMFAVNGENMPWVPVAILGVVGIVLLTTMGVGNPAAEARAPRRAIVIDPEKAAVNNRLETIGWGLFLIMLGGFLLVPSSTIAKGFWSIGVGIIMLGLNATRYAFGIRMSGFTTTLGVISLVGGVLQLLGLEVIEGPFLLIILGLFIVFKPWFDKQQLFGKAEEP